jgi:type IV secretory pathway VirJ component
LKAISKIMMNFTKYFSFSKKISFSAIIFFIPCFLYGQSGSVKTDDNDPFPEIAYKIVKESVTVKDEPIALILSGDGGWYGFEQRIAQNLGIHGIPTIGIDTRKYFWKRKTPEKTASDMEALLKFFSSKWDKHNFIIMGYSQGAEIVPFLISRFTGPVKSCIKSAVLLSPDTTTDFEVHISNMIGAGNSQNTYNVIDEINKILNTNILCIFGDGEKTKVPSILKPTPVRTVFVPGDHHYKGNSTLIVQTMKDNNAF